MNTPDQHYRGRFAPSPTGPLHLGSLFAAVISYLEARTRGGEWLVRIEDIDPLREQPGATTAILTSLEAHGLVWDRPVVYQSQRQEAYKEALDELSQSGRLFWCRCSRRMLSGQTVYPGTCREFVHQRSDAAARFQVPERHQGFEDRFQGWQSCHLASDYGDVIVRRRDGLFAYMLAVVVDDRDQGITDVIRGTDLLSSTFWQLALLEVLGASKPRYGHFPVIIGANGQKLSKQNRAPALDDVRATENLRRIFQYLQLSVEPGHPSVMLDEATELWSAHALRTIEQLHESGDQPA